MIGKLECGFHIAGGPFSGPRGVAVVIDAQCIVLPSVIVHAPDGSHVVLCRMHHDRLDLDVCVNVERIVTRATGIQYR